MEVGIRELRDHLSRYIDEVRAGEELVVTAHGTAVARIMPLAQERRLDRLIAEGVVTAAASPTRRRPRTRIKSTRSVSDLVNEQRR